MDLRWYVRRLRVMGASEIVHRLEEQWSLKLMQVKYHGIGPLMNHTSCDLDRFAFCTTSEPALPELSWRFEGARHEVEDHLAGKIRALGHKWGWRPDVTVWHEAPDTGRIWPDSFFGSIPYRAGNPYGDVRVAWEPSRLQQLVALALLAKNSDLGIGDRAVALLEGQFLSWVEANPLMKGIHYISSMECGLRILSACHALDLVRGRLRRPDQIWSALLDLVEGHAGLIFKRPSRHSSSGNHAIAESAGLIYAGVLFPEFREADDWKAEGLSTLAREAERQILPDGGGIERALRYHLFVVDLCGLVVKLLEHRDQPVPEALRAAHDRGKHFLNAFAERPDRLPSIGDGDGGSALSPFLRLSWGDRKWTPGLTTFDETGYSIIRGGERERARLLFDHGPLGMPPCFGHGHADALSVVLKLGERDLLIDPGTYTYNGDSQWRAYFRGTRAHNTVTVDGEDQAVQEASFIWSRPYRARLVRREETPDGRIALLARHDGYRRLKNGVEHFRGVVYRPSEGWLIWDRLLGNDVHLLDLHWHLGGHLGVEPDGGAGVYALTGPPENVALSVEGGDASLHWGETDPILGWRSRVYGEKKPVMTIRSRFEGTLPHEFVTRIGLGEDAWSDFAVSEELADLRGWIDETREN